MKAIAVLPKREGSAHLIEAEDPSCGNNEVLVKIHQTGICGTDIEIHDGLYGSTPEGCGYLILGHESLGSVQETGKDIRDFATGDLVVATVRRPCSGCVNCESGFSDMCQTGLFRERGISGIHGYMAEYYTESPDFLVKIPKEQAGFAILLEPMSIVEKAIQQAVKIQERMQWRPQRALVLGAGPIGLLATILLRVQDIDTWTVATRAKGSLKADIVEACGAYYLNAKETPVDFQKRKFDLIIEATGNAELAFEAMSGIDTNGVLCLTSITGGNTVKPIPVDKTNLDVVLGNKLVFGTVNANRRYFEQGVNSFSKIEARWPGLLKQMITRETPIEKFHDALVRGHEDIKTVITYDS